MKPQVLITGASGFLGRHIIVALQEFFDIWSISNTNPNGIKSYKSLQTNLLDSNSVTFLKANLDRIKFHAVIHLANINNKKLDPSQTIESANSKVLTHLLDGLTVKPEKFGLFSSVYVYKNPTNGEVLTEFSEIFPTSTYGFVKVNLEKQIIDWGKSSPTEIAIFRPEWVYGPGDMTHKLIPELARAANSLQPYPVIVNFKETRQPIFISDLVASIKSWIGLNLTSKNNIFLLVGPKPVNQEELLIYAKNKSKYPGNPIAKSVDLPGNCLNYAFDNRRTREILNWQPTVDPEQGMDFLIQSLNDPNIPGSD